MHGSRWNSWNSTSSGCYLGRESQSGVQRPQVSNDYISVPANITGRWWSCHQTNVKKKPYQILNYNIYNSLVWTSRQATSLPTWGLGILLGLRSLDIDNQQAGRDSRPLINHRGVIVPQSGFKSVSSLKAVALFSLINLVYVRSWCMSNANWEANKVCGRIGCSLSYHSRVLFSFQNYLPIPLFRWNTITKKQTRPKSSCLVDVMMIRLFVYRNFLRFPLCVLLTYGYLMLKIKLYF